MKKISSTIKNLIKDESGQGTTEYVLLLVVLVAIAMLFRKQIQSIIGDKIEEIKSAIGGFTVN